jgi:hypothetical protein
VRKQKKKNNNNNKNVAEQGSQEQAAPACRALPNQPRPPYLHHKSTTTTWGSSLCQNSLADRFRRPEVSVCSSELSVISATQHQ